MRLPFYPRNAAAACRPREFTTRTRVAIIANSWKAFNKNVGAVEGRGHLVFFRPTAEEVHGWVASWRRDQGVDDDVYQHIEGRLHLIRSPSGRHYLLAQEQKRAGLDWQASLEETWGFTPERLLAAKLAADDRPSAKEREDEFRARTQKSRATYYRYAGQMSGGRGRAAPAGVTGSGDARESRSHDNRPSGKVEVTEEEGDAPEATESALS
jgi:hypothetical protein